MSIANTIRAALAAAGEPQTAHEVHDAVGGDVPSARIASALSAMKTTGEVQCDEEARPRTYVLDPSFKPSRKRPGEVAEPPRKAAGSRAQKPKGKGKASASPAKRKAPTAPVAAAPRSIATAQPRTTIDTGAARMVSERCLRVLSAAVLASDLDLTGSLRNALSEAQRAIAI